ncbi:MAG: stage II sporulation protein M [Methanobrevibacter sp.]|nr:stage II sporulation protein M [Methanobrevibacter sp.]
MNILKKFKDLLFESLRDNKKLIIVFYVFFIVCFIGAWILSADAISASLSGIQNASSSTPTLDNTISAMDILINNEWGGILTYVGSIFFGIFAIISLGYNGVNLGMFGQLFSQYVPNGGLKYIVYLIPHGIFEITATVLHSVAGILLFLFIWRFIRAMISKDVHGASEAFNQKKVLIQSLIIMIFSAILLVIAALIEAYFSVPFSEFIVGA